MVAESVFANAFIETLGVARVGKPLREIDELLAERSASSWFSTH
jgi:hypothetical protein